MTLLLVLTCLAQDEAALTRRLAAGDHDACGAAIESLERLGAKAAASEIARHLRDCPKQETWIRGEAALSRLGEASTVKELLPLLKHDSGSMRSTGLRLLARLGSEETAADALPLLKDEQAQVRIEAVATVAALGGKDAATALTPLLKDKDDRVRLAAAGTLGAVRELTGLLQCGDVHVAADAAVTLARLGAAEALPDLAALLKEDRSWLRANVASSLCRLGSRDGVSPLLDAAAGALRHDIRQEHGDFGSLNALRRPELWKSLREKRLSRDLEGSVAEVLDEVAKEAGLKLEMPAEAPDGLKRSARIRARGGRVSLLEALDGLMSEERCAYLLPVFRHPLAPASPPAEDLSFVLEAGAIRVLRRADALAFWTAWSKESK